MSDHMTRDQLAMSATEADILKYGVPMGGRANARYAFADAMIKAREASNYSGSTFPAEDRRIHALTAMIRAVANSVGPVCSANAENAYHRAMCR